MKVKDLVTLGFQYLKGNKKYTIIYCSITSIILLIISICFTCYNSFKYAIKSAVYDNYYAKTLQVLYNKTQLNYEEAIEKANIEHVVAIHNSNSYSKTINLEAVGNEQLDGTILLHGANQNIIPKIKYGRSFKDGERNVMICPTKILMHGDVADLLSDNFLDGKKLLNNIVQISVSEYDHSTMPPTFIQKHIKNVEIIGLYETKFGFMDDDICFAPFDDVEELYLIDIPKNQETDIDVFLVHIDDARNKETVIQSFNDIAQKENIIFSPHDYFDLDTEGIANTLKIIYTFIVLCVILLAVLMIFFVYKNIKHQKKDISLLKSLGYSNNNIRKTIVMEQWLLLIISFFISLILYGIVYIIAMYIFNNIYCMFLKFEIVFPILSMLLILVLFFMITYFISLFYSNKIAKIDFTKTMY